MSPQWSKYKFFLKKYLFIYLFLAVLGLRFCVRAFSSCGERGPLFIAVRGPLTIAALLVAEHRLQTRRLSSCGSRAQLLCGMWDLSRPGLEPVPPALAGRFSTTAPPGKPPSTNLIPRGDLGKSEALFGARRKDIRKLSFGHLHCMAFLLTNTFTYSYLDF